MIIDWTYGAFAQLPLYFSDGVLDVYSAVFSVPAGGTLRLRCLLGVGL